MEIVLNKNSFLDVPIQVEPMHGVTFSNENKGHKFVVSCMRGGELLTLTGTVTARFMRANNTTILIAGNDYTGIVDGKAVVTLPQDCYNVPGRFQMAIFLTADGATSCIYACVGSVQRTQNEELIDSGEAVPSLTELLAQIDACEQATADATAAANAVPSLVAETFATNKAYTDGSYVYYNGSLYRFTADHAAGAWIGSDATAVKLANDLSDVKSAVSNAEDAIISGTNLKKIFEWEYGSINQSGVETANTTKYYARTKGLYKPKSSSIVVNLVDGTTYFVKVGYNADGTFASGSRQAIAAQSELKVELDTTLKYRFVIMMTSGEYNLNDMSAYITTSYYTAIEMVRDLANDNKGFIDNINTIGKEYIQPTPRTCYSMVTKTLFDNPNYESIQLTPESAAEYYATAQTYANVPLAMYYSSITTLDSTTWIGSQGDYSGKTQYNDEKLIIPTGTKTIIVNNYMPGSANITVKSRTIKHTIEKYSSPIFAQYTGNELSMTVRFSDYSDLAIRMGYHGGNNLFDFIDFTEINDDGTSTVLATNVTDFFGPYRLQAVNNADGDAQSSTSHFVGGNHQYNNIGTGSTPTARGVIDYVLFDNIDAVAGDSAYCKKVVAHWTNYIQGQNTKKADGTGREILREEYTLTYYADKMLIDHVFIPLEDVKIATYYGLQMYFSPSDVQFQYIGGETRIPQGMVDTNSVNRQCRGMIAYNDSFKIIMQMFPIDLGNWILHDDIPESTRYADYSAFINGTVKKAYFNLVSCVNRNGNVYWDFATRVYHEGEHYYFAGEYQFAKPR